MQKTIRILAVVAAALMGISLLLLLISIPFQRSYALLLGSSVELRSALPVIPIVPILYCLLQLGCAALSIVCCGNKKGGIWLEILLVIIMAVLLPVINQFASYAYNVILSRYYGSYYIVANSIASSLANYCTAPATLGQAIAYLACGMSIVFKKMQKNPQETTEEIPA